MNAGGMLVAAPERWDEACFAVPTVRALIASGLDTGILCSESQRKFWETIENLRVVDFPLKSNAKRIAAEITGRWQASIAWEAGLLADTFKIAAIPRRLGPNERKLAKRLTHPLTFVVSPLDHRVQFYLGAIRELGVSAESPDFFAPAAMGVEPNPAAVLLCPDSDFGPSYEWRIDYWFEIASRLLTTHNLVTIANGRDRKLGKQLADKLGVAAADFDVVALANALPGLAGYGLVITADGSLPHIAAHAGATCITLFGPNDPAWKRPLGKRHAVARQHAECAPCLLPKCPLDRRCQNELGIAQVWKVIAKSCQGIPASFPHHSA